MMPRPPRLCDLCLGNPGPRALDMHDNPFLPRSPRVDAIALDAAIRPAQTRATTAELVAELLSSARDRCMRAWNRIALWRRRARERAELRSLTRREIIDFCPKPADAEREMSKPFWRR
jgi:uncharacterized protein YjiS (DUF1127 family)